MILKKIKTIDYLLNGVIPRTLWQHWGERARADGWRKNLDVLSPRISQSVFQTNNAKFNIFQLDGGETFSLPLHFVIRIGNAEHPEEVKVLEEGEETSSYFDIASGKPILAGLEWDFGKLVNSWRIWL